MSSLADRIRGIVSPTSHTGTSPSVAQTFTPAGADLKACAAPANGDVSAVLGGAWQGEDGCRCFVVDRRWEPGARHGRELIGSLAERLDTAAGEAILFSNGAPACPPFVFFDLETTGLNGGAGTLAFLVGCAWFEPDGGFRTRQFLLSRLADERALLDAVAAELGRAGALVSFNGKSFDAPLLEGRYLFHRVPWRGRELPHLDVLHPARRFWKRETTNVPRDASAADLLARPYALARPYPVARPGESSCSLQALERQLVGFRRAGDVPGFEIPARYFQFVRSGDALPLQAVLEHNRLDLLTLAALTVRLLHLARSGPDLVLDAREALALGYVYARGHQQTALSESARAGDLDARARASFRRAIDRCRSPRGAYDPIRIDALRALALACRRARRHEEAATLWRELVDMRGCPAPILREATEALAIHAEHRVRDLVSAKRFALGSLAAFAAEARPSIAEAMRHRLARIERKMGESGRNGQLLD